MINTSHIAKLVIRGGVTVSTLLVTNKIGQLVGTIAIDMIEGSFGLKDRPELHQPKPKWL